MKRDLVERDWKVLLENLCFKMRQKCEGNSLPRKNVPGHNCWGRHELGMPEDSMTGPLRIKWGEGRGWVEKSGFHSKCNGKTPLMVLSRKVTFQMPSTWQIIGRHMGRQPGQELSKLLQDRNDGSLDLDADGKDIIRIVNSGQVNRDTEFMVLAPYWMNILKIAVETNSTAIFHEIIPL